MKMLKMFNTDTMPYGTLTPNWITGMHTTDAGSFHRITGIWSFADYIGQIRARVSSYRMRYNVKPGIYALGAPDESSLVFVTANYKLSFDILRRELKNMSAWILVLDTAGINVWCAAGKGTFGTAELISRITLAGLEKIITHKRIILPQLGAVGVRAFEVRKATGFRIFFGPVSARDIPGYLENNLKATTEMRRIRFSMFDRLVLTPMEINPVMVKRFPVFALAVLIVFGLQPEGIIFHKAISEGWGTLVLGFTSVIAGAFVTPLLLPFVPFRAFSVKGWLVGLIMTLAFLLSGVIPVNGNFLVSASFLFFPAASSYIALQFTGSTTFTGISGVKKELKFALPLYISAAGISVLLIIMHKLTEWGII